MTMTYKEGDKEYVASHSLDQRLRRTELIVIACVVILLARTAMDVYIWWRLDENNFFNQVKLALEPWRQVNALLDTGNVTVIDDMVCVAVR